MKFYFDVTETFIKTIAIEADDLAQAEKRINRAYDCKEFTINHEYPDDVEFVHVQEDVEETIQAGFVAEEELETFDCYTPIYDARLDGWVCPLCHRFIVDRVMAKDIEFVFPKHCDCGAKLKH